MDHNVSKLFRSEGLFELRQRYSNNCIVSVEPLDDLKTESFRCTQLDGQQLACSKSKSGINMLSLGGCDS